MSKDLYLDVLKDVHRILTDKSRRQEAVPTDNDYFYSDSYREAAEVLAPFGHYKPHATADKIIQSTGANVETAYSDISGYLRDADQVILPTPEQFCGNTELYYLHAFTGLAHWSGAPGRLNRQISTVDTEEHKNEALIAGLSALFCTAALGFSEAIQEHGADYLRANLPHGSKNGDALTAVLPFAKAATEYVFKNFNRSPQEVYGADLSL